MLGTSSSACPQADIARQSLVTVTAYIANKTLTAGMHALQLYTYIWLSCMQRDRRSGAANQDSDLEMQYV